MLTQIGLVALGSALGGLSRWGVGVAFERALGKAFPWGTFFINISGSLFLGWFLTLLRHRLTEMTWITPTNLQLLVAVGFTGAYTTFSTFEAESNHLLQEGGLKATFYMAGSVLLGLLAVRLGAWLAE